MEKNENGGCLPDIDLADFNHLVSLDDRVPLLLTVLCAIWRKN